MDKFHERHKLQKFTQEEINNLNSPISIKEIKFVVKNNTTKKTPVLIGFTSEFYQISKEESILIIYEFSQNTDNWRLLPKSFYEARKTLIPKPKIIQENYRPIYFMNMDAGILNKNVANGLQ